MKINWVWKQLRRGSCKAAIMAHKTDLPGDLDKRRRALGLSCGQLAKRSGVSLPTVQRILSGRNMHASLANVVAIAEALGLGVEFESRADPQAMRREQADRKAKQLVGLVQGTSGLEGQAVGRPVIEAMVERTAHELLAGPRRKLWSDV
jgi:transcriptional regulator with XRE-family HTH domain